ncbi:MAG: 4Fe-4S dicluster domain-containing protein [Dehalococcoidia bacterium]|nr:4Fe-4S dicluster domain-containing protein [Dehalococcoidia bacterium]
MPLQLQSTPGNPMNPREVLQYISASPEPDFHNTVVFRRLALWRERYDALQGEAEEEFRSELEELRRAVASDLEQEVAPDRDPGPDLAPQVKERASRLGFAMTGVVRFDRKWVSPEYRKHVRFNNLVVALSEVPAAAMDSVPSRESYLAAFRAELASGKRALAMGDFLRGKGYPVQYVYVPLAGRSLALVHPYAVEAGLGQMGANGQLLSPVEGSRSTLVMLSTDAPMSYDKPVDYGINRLCEECRICVERCPGRALSEVKVNWRGVHKHKINSDRCLSMVARYSGCNVCTKVCPVQKYGLAEVMDHYRGSGGQVLGKGAEELEGYAMDGKGFQGPARRPRFGVADGAKGFMAMADKWGVPVPSTSASEARAYWVGRRVRKTGKNDGATMM